MPSRPTHKLFLIPKEKPEEGKSRSWTEIGVAWSTFDDGTMNLVIKPGTVLDYRLLQDFYLNLKPIMEE